MPTSSFHRLALPLLLGLLTAGCATSAQLAQRDEQRCIDRGYQPKTDAFADCVVRMGNDRDARTEARRREMVETPYIPPMPGGN
jgi:hypothetical protein